MRAAGFINEDNFVKLFHEKKFNKLPFNAQLFLESIYPEVNNHSKIVAYLADGKYKTDFYLKINYTTFFISLKMGHKNSVHVENVFLFTKKLRSLKISNLSIETYLKYHFGDGTTNGKGEDRLTSYILKDIMRDKLQLLNKEFNNSEVIRKLTKETIIGIKEIDFLIYGVPEDFIWISKNQIFDLMLSKKYSTKKIAPHFSNLTIQNMNRCLNYNPKYNRFRYYIQVKWHNIFDDILEYKYKNNIDILY